MLPYTRTQTCRGNVGWTRTLRGASAGHSGRTGRKTIGRPSRASRRPPGTKNKARIRRSYGNQPLHRATCRHSPEIWGNSRSGPAVAAPVPPRGHQKPVSTLRPPFPPNPPSLLDGAAVKLWAAIEIQGEGRTTGALREGLPPKPPIKERPNYLGGTRPRQGPSLYLAAIRRRRRQTAWVRLDEPTP